MRTENFTETESRRTFTSGRRLSLQLEGDVHIQVDDLFDHVDMSVPYMNGRCIAMAVSCNMTSGLEEIPGPIGVICESKMSLGFYFERCRAPWSQYMLLDQAGFSKSCHVSTSANGSGYAADSGTPVCAVRKRRYFADVESPTRKISEVDKEDSMKWLA